MNRVSFLVDGFNLYHSVRRAERDLKASTKWLDIKRLCSSYLYIVAQVVGERTKLEKIYYFSALARHLEAKHPKVTHRHEIFIKCLIDTGVIVELSRFKPKTIRCPNPLCRKEFTKAAKPQPNLTRKDAENAKIGFIFFLIRE